MPVNLIPSCKKISVNKMPDPFLSFFFFLNLNILLYTVLHFFVHPIRIKKNFLLTRGLKYFFLCWFWLDFCETEVILISSKIVKPAHCDFLSFLWFPFFDSMISQEISDLTWIDCITFVLGVISFHKLSVNYYYGLKIGHWFFS